MATQHTLPEIDLDLIRKYTIRGPRYTSYPTAPEWTESVGSDVFRKHIHETNSAEIRNPLSLYFHIPFCPKRCYYCACNVIVTPRPDVTNHYVDLLMREMDLVVPKIHPDRTVTQLHLGGGTPTHLTPPQLDRLLSGARNRFAIEENAEQSIEVDVRITNDEHLHVLRQHGFNRISFGAQDFSERVQQAIGRIQTVERTEEFTGRCRDLGFDSMNIDLVCGLPFQTVESFQDTITTILRLNPDRIAFYNYAYLPSKMPYQRRIDPSTLPSSDERFAIFRSAIERFTAGGYVYIGMDHFAKRHDELAVAQSNGTLQRNFMGLTTRAGTDLYAFGVSSISSLPRVYVQNTKNLRQYEQALDAGDFPIERGIELTRDDRLRRWIIMELMCNLHLDFAQFNRKWNEHFNTYFKEEIASLTPFVEDGLLEPDLTNGIRLTPLGQIVVRPIVMTFDAYLTKKQELSKQTPLFSQTL
ncbi:MAG: oxygen-independent coproporphyrinogen III oxidase [bacterium]